MLVKCTWVQFSGVRLQDLQQIVPTRSELRTTIDIDEYFLGRFCKLDPYCKKVKIRILFSIRTNIDKDKLWEDLLDPFGPLDLELPSN